MSLPLINGPADVPELRQWLINRTRPGGVLEGLDGRFIHRTMQTASLWWVEPETCQLLAEAAPTWPTDATLDMTTLPTPAGFAVFDHDMIGCDAARPDRTVRVSAVCWGPATLPPLADGQPRLGLGIGMFTRMALHKGLDVNDLERTGPILAMMLPELFPPGHDGMEVLFTDDTGEGELRSLNQVSRATVPMQGDLYAYIGRTDWLHDTGVEALVVDAPRTDETARRSMAEDRRLLATLWAITQTPVVSTVRTKPPRHVARRSTRKGLDPAVRILRLGGPHRDNITTGTPAKREWRHSWVVRPFWRWQNYGLRAEGKRKLILVGPYVKGPADKPLLGGDRVLAGGATAEHGGGMSTVYFSPHAKLRRKQMRVTEHEIEAAIAEPDITWLDGKQRLSVRGRLCIVTSADGSRVVTVLWHGRTGR